MAEDIPDRLLAALDAAEDLVIVILHGSAATAAEGSASDVDVVVAAAQTLAVERLLAREAVMGQRLRRQIDLRDLHRIDGLFLHRVLSTGRVLRNRDPGLLARRACEAMDWATDVLPAARSGQRRYLAAITGGDGAAA
jgi:predicted nucleotidyltransferase